MHPIIHVESLKQLRLAYEIGLDMASFKIIIPESLNKWLAIKTFNYILIEENDIEW